MHADVERIDGRYYLEIKGEPNSDDMGVYTFYFGAEQEPEGSGYRAAPALVTLNIVPTAQTGFRALLRNTPSSFSDRFYRNVYPDFGVQAAYRGDDPDARFTGTITCTLTASGTLIFSKPCAQDAPFPWPDRLIDGGMTASVVASSPGQEVDDTVYSMSLHTRFVHADVSVDAAAAAALRATARLSLTDFTVNDISGGVAPPYSQQRSPGASHGYRITCSNDGSAWRACLDNGTVSLLRVPGRHQLRVRVVAPDDAVRVSTVSWSVGTPAQRFAVRLNRKKVHKRAKLRVQATGLLPREHYRIKVGAVALATGIADDLGRVDRVVKVRKTVKAGKRAVKVIGVNGTRHGKHPVRVRRR